MPKTYKSPLVVGLTGGIGAGKSTIVNTIEDMGIPVFDCDANVHELYRDPDNLLVLTERYGDLGIHPRHTLAKMAWADPKIRKELEEFLIPQVNINILAFIDAHVAKERKVIVIDAPTLLEHGFQDIVDWIVIVEANVEQRADRVMGRHDMTIEKFNAVVAAQVDDFTRRAAADSVIFNNSTLESAVLQTRNIFTKLQRIANA